MTYEQKEQAALEILVALLRSGKSIDPSGMDAYQSLVFNGKAAAIMLQAMLKEVEIRETKSFNPEKYWE